jgi:hypothetical protein
VQYPPIVADIPQLYSGEFFLASRRNAGKKIKATKMRKKKKVRVDATL